MENNSIHIWYYYSKNDMNLLFILLFIPINTLTYIIYYLLFIYYIQIFINLLLLNIYLNFIYY